MRNDLKIRTLTERFFDGETSLAEEQELYRLYREGDVPEDLLQYKELGYWHSGFHSDIACHRRYTSYKKQQG